MPIDRKHRNIQKEGYPPPCTPPYLEYQNKQYFLISLLASLQWNYNLKLNQSDVVVHIL